MSVVTVSKLSYPDLLIAILRPLASNPINHFQTVYTETKFI